MSTRNKDIKEEIIWDVYLHPYAEGKNTGERKGSSGPVDARGT